jgi:hypothetical protein
MSRRPRIVLPRYLRAKPLAGDVTAYFWELPTWARPPTERHGRLCPVASEPLGQDLATAIGKADLLNKSLDEWRLGAGNIVVTGSVKWLFGWYRGLDRFTGLAWKTRRDYRRWMDALVELTLKSGGKLGDRKASEIQGTTADRIHARLVEAHGERSARYAVQVASRAWNEAGRNPRATGISSNPWAKMGLSTRAAQGNAAFSRFEYDVFRHQARSMGAQSMATAAAIMFEMVRRARDTFGFEHGDELPRGGVFWEDYRPGEMFALTQGKTRADQGLALADDDGQPLYPDLEEELARTPRAAPDRELDGRRVTTIVINERTGRRYTEDEAGDRFREIRDAAGLSDELTLTSFRHGGATELGDAGVEDIRPVSGHATRASADVYDKITTAKSRSAGARRRQFVEARR